MAVAVRPLGRDWAVVRVAGTRRVRRRGRGCDEVVRRWVDEGKGGGDVLYLGKTHCEGLLAVLEPKKGFLRLGRRR